MTVRPDPQVAPTIFTNCDGIGAPSRGGELKIFVSMCASVNAMESIVGADPQDSLTVLKNRADKGFILVSGISKIMTVTLEGKGPCCKTGYPEASQTCPNDPLSVLEQSAHTVLSQTLGIGKAIAITDKSSMCPVEFEQSGAICS